MHCFRRVASLTPGAALPMCSGMLQRSVTLHNDRRTAFAPDLPSVRTYADDAVRAPPSPRYVYVIMTLFGKPLSCIVLSKDIPGLQC